MLRRLPIVGLLRCQPPALLAATLLAWAALVTLDNVLLIPTLCSGPGSLLDSAGNSLEAIIRINSPAAVVCSWILMLFAMMPPLLAAPLGYLWHGSLKRRRIRAISVFALGYLCVWTCAAVPLLTSAVLLNGIAWKYGIATVWLAVLLALIWHAAPLKQHCLNRCHRLPPISAFGTRADIDTLRFGVSHGLWCIGGCWATMLVPLTVVNGHLLVMGLAAGVLFVERQRRSRRPRWRVPFFDVAQIAILRGTLLPAENGREAHLDASLLDDGVHV